MQLERKNTSQTRLFENIAIGARVVLGGLFVYMGLVKAMDPVGFLKLVREYDVTDSFAVLNLVAAVLPWFEIFTGTLLVLGIAVRGTGLIALAMLIPFTILISQRAAGIQQAQGTPFCLIRFDCGCGGGEVLICRKLIENVGLMVLALITIVIRSPLAALHYQVVGSRGSNSA